jgi:hypothetical protein
MPTTYPGAIDDYDLVPESQAAITAHRERHQDIEDAMEAVQTFVGTSAATDATSVAGRVKQMQSNVNGLGLALNGTAPGGAVNQASTGQHFTQNGARIHRLNDRVFINAATQNDGAFPNVERSWMEDYWVAGGFSSGPLVSALLGVVNDTNPNNAIGVMSAVRTKDFASAGSTALPIMGVAFNDHPTLGTKVYAGYFEGHRTSATAADTYGVEIDVRTLTASVQSNPRLLGDVSALQLGIGAEWSPTGQQPASSFIQMAYNGQRAYSGINIMHDALVDIGGGVTQAVNMNRYSLLSWFDATGARSGFVTSSATAAATGVTMDLANGQVLFRTVAGALGAAFNIAPSSVNYPTLYSGISTQPVRILAGGTDTNIDLSLEPKGAGQVVIPIAQVRNAANDAAAAALVPPVPIGGIYRNGSVLQIRVA